MNEALEFLQIQQLLKRGDIFAYPTETVYGLGVDPFQKTAVQKVMDLKGRSLQQTPLLLIPDKTWLDRLTRQVSPSLMRIIDYFWPGSLTIVFNASREVPSWLLRDDETIALRWSSHPWVNAFLQFYKEPMVSTSANPTGKPSAESSAQVKAYFPSGLAYVVEGQTLSEGGSTIISFQEHRIQVLRKGSITLEAIERISHG